MPKDPVSEYTYRIARQRVASICLALGWNSANSSAMEVSFSRIHFLLNGLKFEIEVERSGIRFERKCITASA